MIPFINYCSNVKTKETEDHSVVARGWGWGTPVYKVLWRNLGGGGDETVLYTDCGGSYMNVHICQN